MARRIDFIPGSASAKRIPIQKPPTEDELRLREMAKAQVKRREEIQREIERQNEADILAKRRADAARRELARQRAIAEESARARATKEAEREEELLRERQMRARKDRLDRIAKVERRRLLEARRIEIAKLELSRREQASAMKIAQTRVDDASGSIDPLATRLPNTPPPAKPTTPIKPATSSKSTATSIKISTATSRPAPAKPTREVTIKPDTHARRIYGKITRAEKLATQAEQDYKALHPETLGDIDEFAEEVDDIISESLAVDTTDTVEEDTSNNNHSYVLGGKSPFINTDRIVKRPLSGDVNGFKSSPASPRSSRSSDRSSRSSDQSATRSQSIHLNGTAAHPSRDSRSAHSSQSTHPSRTIRPASRITKNKPLLGGPKPNSYVSPADYPSASRYVPYEEPVPHKNIYGRQLEAEKNTTEDLPTMVMAGGEKGSGIVLAIVVLITVILGAAVGVIAYLAFFQ